LSRDIQKKRADESDQLLDAWGIQHLHFKPEGTDWVLFAKITDSDIFVLQALQHGRGFPAPWVNTLLLQIVHDNWPEAAGGKVVGPPGESLTAREMTALRGKMNANFCEPRLWMAVSTQRLGRKSRAFGRCFSDVCDGRQDIRLSGFLAEAGRGQ